MTWSARRPRVLSPGTRASVFATVLIAMVVQGAAAQNRRPDSASSRFVAETWNRGVPGNAVRRLSQSREGYLLLATDGGLGLFDGARFTVHRSYAGDFPDSLPDLYLNDVIVASDGAVWMASMHAGAIVRRNGAFRAFGSAAGLPDDDAGTVFEDVHRTIWVGTKAGLARRVGDRFEPIPGTERLNVTSLAADVDGNIWVGTDYGLLRLINGKVERFRLPLLNYARIPRILRASDGSMWVATSEGLVRLVRDARGSYNVAQVYGTRDGLRSRFVMGLAEQSNGVIWVATMGGGIAHLKRDGRFASFGANEGLADNNVSDIFIDRESNIWANTGGGLTRVRAPTIENLQSSEFWSTSVIWSVRADRDGTVWAGTGGDGVVRIDRDGSTTRVYAMPDGLPSDAVLTSYRTRDGTLWVGTRRGIARLDGNRFVDMTLALGLWPVGVRSIYEDAAGRFYVGTDSALLVGTMQRVAPIPRAVKLPGGRVYKVVQDQHGRVWVAGSRLAYVDGDSLRLFVSAQHDSLTQPMDIYPDTAGIWVGDYGRGLSLLRGDSLLFFPPNWTGVLSQVEEIVDDGRGALWLTSGMGLERVTKADLVAWLRKNPAHVRTRLFTKDDGLRSHDFGKGGSSSGTRAPDGRLWLPTSAGLVVFDPSKLRFDPVVPQVFIERVIADGVALPHARPLDLPRGTQITRFEFTTPMLAAPSRVRMWFKLEGVDTAWRTLSDPLDRSATYENLPQGTFEFLVRAQSADGVPEEAPAHLQVVSTLPLTKKAWFWALLSLLVVGAGTAGYRWRIGQLRRHTSELQRLVDERTEALAARERIEHQLLHAQKLESVGRLAGGVAHDLNNLLTAILGHAELALGEPGIPKHVHDDVNEVRTVAMRAANLTRQLLAFARKTVVQPRHLRLGEVVANVEALVRRLLPEHIVLSIESLEGDWAVYADPSQVEQVIMNLALNARDAMPAAGRLAIRTRAESVGADFVQAHPEFAPGDYVVLEVEDSGTGMTPDVQAHLFEPFFTTKEQGKGTGLGLATAFGIVTQVGGHILVESRVAVGSTFQAYFPRTAGVVARQPAAIPAKMPRGTERLLLVEDEDAVRTVSERTLRAVGYEVMTARDGMEALEVLEAQHGRFSLVLSDVRMPRLDGLELADRVRKSWPGLTVAHMSGHSEALLTDTGEHMTSQVLRKPFTASELTVFVRDALRTRPK